MAIRNPCSWNQVVRSVRENNRSVSNKRRSIRTSGHDWAHFRTWRTARWLVALLMPIAFSVGALLANGRQWWEGGILGLLGLTVAFVLFETVQSGESSSNWGTFRRDLQPVRFWIDVAILAAAYLALAVAGYVA